MLRGCLLSLAFLVALGVGYYYWLDQTFEPPGSMIAGGIAGFLVLCCLGALNNARIAWSDGVRASRAGQDLQLVDGRVVTVSGTIHPLGEPLQGPFSGTPCVMCEYDLASQQRLSSSSDNENSGSDYAGFLMAPCAIRTPFGEVRVLGFPIMEGFAATRSDNYVAMARAREFMQTHEFEDRTGLKMVSVLSVFGEIWSDDDGLVQKNMRLRNVSLDEIFPPSLDEDLQKIIKWREERPQDFEDNDDEEDGDEDEADDDYVSPGFTTEIPKLEEKRVDVGEQVCAIGVYNEMQGGLLPPRGTSSPTRLLKGSPEQIEVQSGTKVRQNIVGGLIGLVVIHGVILLAMWIYQQNDDIRRDQQQRAEKAARSGELDQLAPLIRRGLDINFRDSNGRTLLMHTEDPALTAWLIEHGADVNVADQQRETALTNAARTGNPEIVRQLIAAHAELNPRSSATGQTPLTEAEQRGHEAAAKLLREAGATE